MQNLTPLLTGRHSWNLRAYAWLWPVVLVLTGCVDLTRPWDKWAPDAGKPRDTATEAAPIERDGARPSTGDTTSPPLEDAALPTEEDAPTPVIPDIDAEADRPADAPLARDAGVDASQDTRADRMDAMAVDGRSDLAPKLDQRNFDSSETLADAALDVPADSFALLDACVGCDRPVDEQDTDAPHRHRRAGPLEPGRRHGRHRVERRPDRSLDLRRGSRHQGRGFVRPWHHRDLAECPGLERDLRPHSTGRKQPRLLALRWQQPKRRDGQRGRGQLRRAHLDHRLGQDRRAQVDQLRSACLPQHHGSRVHQ